MSEWEQFYSAVSGRVREFKRAWGKTAVPFFRGHGDNRWKLLPGALRANCDCATCAIDGGRYIEQSLYYEYVSGAGMLLANDLISWDVAFSMQHYGLPTRLLDWTENFSVALFFAVRELARNDSESGVLWFLEQISFV
ncbi:MAG TPA: FRG domain-containing protein [Pyrinomonadaceae bacterium]